MCVVSLVHFDLTSLSLFFFLVLTIGIVSDPVVVFVFVVSRLVGHVWRLFFLDRSRHRYCYCCCYCYCYCRIMMMILVYMIVIIVIVIVTLSVLFL